LQPVRAVLSTSAYQRECMGQLHAQAQRCLQASLASCSFLRLFRVRWTDPCIHITIWAHGISTDLSVLWSNIVTVTSHKTWSKRKQT
jgi:hypothetical protein